MRKRFSLRPHTCGLSFCRLQDLVVAADFGERGAEMLLGEGGIPSLSNLPNVGARVSLSSKALWHITDAIPHSYQGQGTIVPRERRDDGGGGDDDNNDGEDEDSVSVLWDRTARVVTYPRMGGGLLAEASPPRAACSVGERVRMRRELSLTDPQLYSDSAGGAGTVTWVDPGGEGIRGGIEVLWDWTGVREMYKESAGSEPTTICTVGGTRDIPVGVDVRPARGQSVRISKAAESLFPPSLVGSGARGRIAAV